jgi:hypothetical protein
VVAQTLGGPLSPRLIGWIVVRITLAIHRVADIAARVAAGTYRPRRPAAAPRRAPGRPPPRNGPAPKQCGWLVPLLPFGGAQRAALDQMLRDPEMVALMQAAPAPIGRVLRPLCWMLALDLPPALARRKAAPSDPAAAPSLVGPSPAAASKPPRPRRPRAPPPPRPAPPQPAAGLALELGIGGRPRLVWT